MCKKLVYLVSFVLVLGLVLPGVANAADPSLVGWWKFNGDANDSSGYDNHGTAFGGPGYVGGILGQAIDLDGVDDLIDVDHGTIATDVYSMAFWHYPRNLPYSGGYRALMHTDAWNAGAVHLHLRENRRVNFDWNGGPDVTASVASALVSDQWYHITMIADRTVSPAEAKIYIDGVLEGSNTGTSSALILGPFNIGAYRENDRHVDGLFDDFRVYDRALTVDDIQAIMVGDPNIASGPYPPSGSIVAPGPINCTWSAGDNAAEHNVYFGTDPNALNGPFTKPVGEPNYAPPGGAAPGTTYYWRVDEVNTAHPNSPWAGPLWSFSTYREAGMGKITFDIWRNIPTADLPYLTSHPNYPDNPDETGYRTMFEGPRDYAADFGARMHGWLMPETSGDYTFFVASDDDSELWLSTDKDKSNAQLICFEYGVSGFRNWDPARTSAAIPLIGGEKYYISGIWKEGGGGDYLSVAWQGGPGSDQPDAPVNGSADQIIDGYYLWPFVQYWATGPSPADGVLTDGEIMSTFLYQTLNFTPGVDANTHEPFFSDNYDEVKNRDPSRSLGEPTDPVYPTIYYAGAPAPYSTWTDSLVRGTTYYWCVDETDIYGQVWKGPVWSFSIRLERAWDPNPQDGALVLPTSVLSWKAGALVTITTPHEHDVYFGTNEAAVTNATDASPLGVVYFGKQSFGNETWDPNTDGFGPLDYDTTYYWRIDEVHNRAFMGTPIYITGDTWSFTTIPVIPITSDPNLVGHWKLDEGAGNLAIDWSGYNHHGTLRGDPTWILDGQFGGALEFDGYDDYVNIDGYKGILGGNPFSISAWLKKTTTEDCSIVSWGNNAGGQRVGFRLNNIRLRMEHGNGNIEGVTANVVTDGEWHHVAVTVIANARIQAPDVTLYLDGQDDTGGATDADTFNIVSNLDVSIGRRATHNDRYYNGAIDDVRIYQRELSAAEIKDLATPPFAWNPNPPDGFTTVDPTEVAGFSWSPGAFAAQHDLYWGTDYNDVLLRTTPNVTIGPNSYTMAFAFDTTYYWRVDEVNSLHPEGPWKGDVWTFGTVREAGMGTILVELWANLVDLAPGNNLDDLKLDPRFLADTPDASLEVPRFHSGTQPLGPDPLSNDYGGRVHGWLIPKTTGDYRFWLATDDPGELWLNPDGPDPSGAELIAYIPTNNWSAQYDWFKYTTQDSNDPVNYGGLIHLEANQRYYIRGLWKEAGGGDHCVVAWYCPDSPDVNILPVNGSGDAVIDGYYLMPFTRFWASNPNPYHTQELSAEEVTLLSWTPGVDAATQDIYFGTSLSDVETGAPPVISGLARNANTYDPHPIEWETKYYWRIDEVNDANTWTGSIWWFKTTNYAVLDDFEPYLSADTGTDPNALRYVWKDGYWFYVSPLIKSKSGSNIMLTGPDDPPKPYLHWDDYRGGAQGLALYYDNDGNTIRLGHPDANIYPVHKYSEIEATTGDLGVDPNWTRQDIKALSLWFKGNPTGRKGSFEFTGIDASISPYGLFDATLIAAGADIGPVGPAGGPYHDEFHYAYKKLEPSVGYLAYGSIEVRVDDVNDTNPEAKAGVMMRETWHVDSNFVMVVVTPGSGIALQYRRDKRGTVENVPQPGITAPHWVKLSRDIYGYYYAEHANDVEHAQIPPLWHYINDDSAASTVDTLYMGDAVYAGLCLTSHNAAQLCKAEFSSIKFTADEPQGSWFTGFWNSRDIGIISNDPELMYLALEDTSANVGVVYYDTNGTPDPNAVLIETWTPWNIDLANPNFASVDMNFVDMVYIGFGDRDYPQPGGSGVVYFDDIRLYRSRFVPGYYPLIPGNIWRDSDGLPDGVVDWKDLKVMADDWLLSDEIIPTVPVSDADANLVAWYEFEGDANDSGPNGYHGDPCGAPTYATGVVGSYAIDLDGTDDYVYTGKYASELGIGGNNPRTVSVWVYTRAFNNGGIWDVGNRSNSQDFSLRTRGGTDQWRVQYWGGADHDFTYDSLNKWVHFALVFEPPSNSTCYADGEVISAVTDAPLNTTDDNPFQIGCYGWQNDYFDGIIDDVRIYDRALLHGEVTWLAVEGATYLHIPVDSDADIYTHPTLEPPGKQAVNFRDFAVLANDWLEEELKWPLW